MEYWFTVLLTMFMFMRQPVLRLVTAHIASSHLWPNIATWPSHLVYISRQVTGSKQTIITQNLEKSRPNTQTHQLFQHVVQKHIIVSTSNNATSPHECVAMAYLLLWRLRRIHKIIINGGGDCSRFAQHVCAKTSHKL